MNFNVIIGDYATKQTGRSNLQ